MIINFFLFLTSFIDGIEAYNITVNFKATLKRCTPPYINALDVIHASNVVEVQVVHIEIDVVYNVQIHC